MCAKQIHWFITTTEEIYSHTKTFRCTFCLINNAVFKNEKKNKMLVAAQCIKLFVLHVYSYTRE